MRRDEPAASIEGFEILQPPPGGLVGLRTRLEQQRRRRVRTRRAAWAAALALTVLAVAVPLAPSRSRGDLLAGTSPAAASPSLVALGLVEPPADSVSVTSPAREQVAVQRVVETEAVVYYRVARLD